MSQPHLQIVVGSTRPGRRGLAVDTWIHDLAVRHAGFTVELVDLDENAPGVLDELLRLSAALSAARPGAPVG